VWQTDTRTDGHWPTASTAFTRRRAVKLRRKQNTVSGKFRYVKWRNGQQGWKMRDYLKATLRFSKVNVCCNASHRKTASVKRTIKINQNKKWILSHLKLSSERDLLLVSTLIKPVFRPYLNYSRLTFSSFGSGGRWFPIFAANERA